LSWCDKLASTPSVGIRLDPHFISSSTLLDLLTPLLDTLNSEEKSRFNITKQDSFNVELTTDNGFHYGFEPNRIYIDFRHRMKVKTQSGGPPVVEMISSPEPYSKLLPIVCERIEEATTHILKSKGRTIDRVGIVTTTTVLQDEAPPGIRRFIDYLAKPWNSPLDHFEFQITSQLNDEKDWEDRCIHQFSKAEDSEGLITMKFDWQRTFKKEKNIMSSTIKERLSHAQEAALLYFEELAEGNRFDE
jgi:hypothetical protein